MKLDRKKAYVLYVCPLNVIKKPPLYHKNFFKLIAKSTVVLISRFFPHNNPNTQKNSPPGALWIKVTSSTMEEKKSSRAQN